MLCSPNWQAKLKAGLKADYITIGGSGEPTLNSRLGDLIDGIRRLTDIRVAILTNGTLLYRRGRPGRVCQGRRGLPDPRCRRRGCFRGGAPADPRYYY